MKNKVTKKQIIEAIRLTWKSLDSHLYYSDSKEFNKAEIKYRNKGKRIDAFEIRELSWHRKVSKEYAEILHTLTNCL